MKAQNFLVALSISAFYLMGNSRVQAGDILLHQLLGTYVPYSSVLGDTKINDLTFRIEATRLVCVDSKGNAYNATYKDQSLFIDFDRGLFPIGRNLPKFGRYVPTRWGERIYLIHPNEISGFCDAINAGIEPQAHWDQYHYYLKGGWGGKVTGDPDLPAAYKSLLLSKPVSGKVVELAEKGMGWVDFGSDSGIRPKMMLMSHWMPNQLPNIKMMPGMIEPRTNLVTVLTVEKDRCLIEGELLEVGTPITSRHWN